MLLYNSSLIKLEYDPATDILSMDWPDLQDFYVAEVEREMNVLIDTIKHFDVKKLLIDTSKARVEVKTESYLSFLSAFACDLKATRLQKFARIGTNNPDREKVTDQARDDSQIREVIEFRNFRSKNEALDWLLI